MKGANRTGRPFTGDFAGDLLYKTLLEFGFARGNFDPDGKDDLELIDTRITNAARCVPPKQADPRRSRDLPPVSDRPHIR